MQFKKLLNLINNIFKPVGYEKKNTIWTKKQPQITKIIQLQKSQFNKDRYFIDYGFIINAIPLINLKKHIIGRIEISQIQIQRITELLLLNNDISDSERENELTDYLFTIKAYMESINSEQDIFEYIERQQNLNDIPLVVKKYFNIE